MKGGTGLFIGLLVGILGGGAAGVFGTKKYFDEKYQQQANEEIEKCKQAFLNAAHPVRKEEPKVDTRTAAIQAGTKYVTEDKVNDFVNMLSSAEPEPRIISVDDFRDREDEGYRTIELHYYINENILVSKDNKKIEDSEIARVIGTKWKEVIKPETTDEVYIRNDKFKVDVAVVKDLRKFTE